MSAAVVADEPFFSVLITAFNRPTEVVRAIRSCCDQSFADLEIVVVDDASTDTTPQILASIDEPRLRVVTHDRNGGISAARATTVDHARGRWLVMLDSDWELMPDALAHLARATGDLPPGVRMIRSQIRWDDGTVSPRPMPDGVTGYEGRLEWLDEVIRITGASDAGHCIRRDLFEEVSFPRDRRGAVEVLWETDLARRERSLWFHEILIMQYTDAANSFSRDMSPRRLVPRLLREAADSRWVHETMLARHGGSLARHSHLLRWVLQNAALDCLLCGDRRAGIRHSRGALQAGGSGSRILATLALGLLGPRPLAWAKAIGRQWRGRRSSD